jgi:hypothetical protein
LISRQLCSYSRTSQHFMEPEGSLECPWAPLLVYFEPDQSSPYHTIISLLRSILILSDHLYFGHRIVWNIVFGMWCQYSWRLFF